ncbi:YlxR family protein [Saccharomonospora halophila]|uniref:YlxR family protein n=1 Tax=Saccharomonospora halophila TaxID=129922 RepID=UPI001E5BE13C|nr:YlxR family protein [Saccharomonospora halophila]
MVAADGHVVVDERRRLPGRGAWLHPDRGCLGRAERRRAFPRALRAKGVARRGRSAASCGATHPERGQRWWHCGCGNSPHPDRNKEAGRPVMSQP